MQRREIAREEYAKAARLFAEAEFIHKSGRAPSSTVHTAYFAFEHLACAAILLFGGAGAERGFPKSHRDIILHNGKFTTEETGEMAQFGSKMTEVYSLREAADYHVSRDPTLADAEFAVVTARHLMAECRMKWKTEIDLNWIS